MGSGESITKEPTGSQLAQLASETHFNEEEIHRLYAAFVKIAGRDTPDHLIQPEEFFVALGIQNVEYGNKIFKAFDKSNNGTIEFDEYIRGISSVCERASVEERARFCFDIYDIDHSGHIGYNELYDIVSVSLSSDPRAKVPEVQIRKIAAKLFRDIDKSQDNSISFEEFLAMAKTNDGLVNCVKLRIQPLIDGNV